MLNDEMILLNVYVVAKVDEIKGKLHFPTKNETSKKS